MAIRVRHGVRGTRYAVIFRDDDGVQHSRTFTTPEEAGEYQQQVTARVVVECGCQPRPRRLRLPRVTLEAGKIICGVCGSEFSE